MTKTKRADVHDALKLAAWLTNKRPILTTPSAIATCRSPPMAAASSCGAVNTGRDSIEEHAQFKVGKGDHAIPELSAG